MKYTKILSGTVIAAFAAIMFSAGLVTSYAESENSAEVLLEWAFCVVLNPDGIPIAADASHFMQNKNNAKVTCQTFGVPNPSGEDLRTTGVCNVFGGKFGDISGTYFNQISDNGDGTADIVLQCHAKAP